MLGKPQNTSRQKSLPSECQRFSVEERKKKSKMSKRGQTVMLVMGRDTLAQRTSAGHVECLLQIRPPVWSVLFSPLTCKPVCFVLMGLLGRDQKHGEI